MLRWLWLSVLVLLLDQGSKQLMESLLLLYEQRPILPFFNLTLAYNEGAAFSFLSEQGGWQRWFFTVLAALVTAVLIGWLARLKRHEQLLAVALAMIIGGALGNLLDRLLWGHVIDFLDLYYGSSHWPAFNLADSFIFTGVALMLFDSMRGGARTEQ